MHRTILKTFGKITRKISKHGRLILTITSLVGLGESVYLTAKVAPIADDALLKARLHKGEDLTISEKIKIAGPIYAPVALCVVGTGACIISNHRLGTKRINKAIGAAVAARKAYMSLAGEFNEYRETVAETAGAEGYSAIENAFAKKTLDKIDDKTKQDAIRNAPGKDKEGAKLCWLQRQDYQLRDKKAGDFFWATPEELDAAEGLLNKHMQEYGWVDIDSYRGYFDLPYEEHSFGYNLRCECFSGGWRENDWITVSQTYAPIGDIWCTVLDFDKAGLCENYQDACCGDAEECQYEVLPFK